MYLNVITKRGQDGLQQVAEATGGTAFVPDREEDLDSVFAQIAAELRAQYLLQSLFKLASVRRTVSSRRSYDARTH